MGERRDALASMQKMDIAVSGKVLDARLAVQDLGIDKIRTALEIFSEGSAEEKSLLIKSLRTLGAEIDGMSVDRRNNFYLEPTLTSALKSEKNAEIRHEIADLIFHLNKSKGE